MEMTDLKAKFPMRQALLKVTETKKAIVGFEVRCWEESNKTPVLVWPTLTQDGCFIAEHRDGHCQKVKPYELTFIDSKELFEQYDWKET